MLLSIFGSCCLKLDTGQNFGPTEQPSTFLLFYDRRSVAQQCWIRYCLYSSFNIVGATHVQNTWSPKSYGLYPSHDALQVLKLLGVDAAVCTTLATRTQQLPTLLAQHCWELLCPSIRGLNVNGYRQAISLESQKM